MRKFPTYLFSLLLFSYSALQAERIHQATGTNKNQGSANDFANSNPNDFNRKALKEAKEKKQVVLISVGLGWCPACSDLHDVFRTLKEDRSFKEQVGLVELDAEDDRDLIKDLKQEFDSIKPSWPVLLAIAKDKDGKWISTVRRGRLGTVEIQALISEAKTKSAGEAK